ncbi:MAG: 16S rRNA (uracil(1498)-N(3))-methyltransferase [Porticoccaceae bacterium]
MNLLLLSPSDFYHQNRARIDDRRLLHLQNILKTAPESILKVGLIDGKIGSGTVLKIDATMAELEVSFERDPPPALPVTLILALPRPKALRRIIRNVTVLGVKRIHLINTWKVEKSYWQSPLLRPESIQEQLILGLEQAVDTILPEVSLHPLFKPFVEDQLSDLSRDTQCYVAHPNANDPAPPIAQQPTTLAVGPEGGFIDYEIRKLMEIGFLAVSLGPRILPVEVAVNSFLSH